MRAVLCLHNTHPSIFTRYILWGRGSRGQKGAHIPHSPLSYWLNKKCSIFELSFLLHVDRMEILFSGSSWKEIFIRSFLLASIFFGPVYNIIKGAFWYISYIKSSTQYFLINRCIVYTMITKKWDWSQKKTWEKKSIFYWHKYCLPQRPITV